MLIKKSKNPYPRDLARKQGYDKLLGQMICTDMQLFSIVEDRGFRAFCNALDNRYELPSKRTITRYVLHCIIYLHHTNTYIFSIQVVHVVSGDVALYNIATSHRHKQIYIYTFFHSSGPRGEWQLFMF